MVNPPDETLRGIIDRDLQAALDRDSAELELKTQKAQVAAVASIGKSEADRAAELKERTRKALIEVCAIMDEGLREGLLIRWANIAINAYGRHEVVDLHIEKRF